MPRLDARILHLWISLKSAFLEEEEESADMDAIIFLALARRRQSMHQISRRIRIPNRPRDRAAGHIRLLGDYFVPNSVYGDELFRRRFCSNRTVFRRYEQAVVANCDYFVQQVDACGLPGLSSLQKVTAVIRMLVYDGSADQQDEYVRIGESTALRCLHKFWDTMVRVFGPRYLRSPTTEDTVRILKHSAKWGWPGMLGSIDCMHWTWKQCPIGWAGQFQNKKGAKLIILEAIATKDLWVWHSYFGMPGSNNDLNVLDRSHLFHELLRGNSPRASFRINNQDFEHTYYLADGIYPSWPMFVKTISNPVGEVEMHFAMRQEATRKDIERAFGVLRQRWAILCNPSRLWHRDNLHNVIMTCLIIHNMIVEDEHSTILDCLGWTGNDVVVTPPEHP